MDQSPACHPDKALKARGLCSTCYLHFWKKKPGRKRRIFHMGVIQLGDRLPDRPDPDHRVVGLPPSCRKCHAPANALRCQDGRVQCQLCGWDAVLMRTA